MMEKELEIFEELMLDYLAGKLSEDKEKKLLHFLKSDVFYRQRYEEMARTRAKSFIGRFEKEKQTNYAALSARLGLGRDKKKIKTPVWHTFSRVAAIVLLALTTTISTYYIYRDAAEASRADALCQIEVPLGSQTKLILPDGTTVCLNSGSVLKYDPAFLRKKNREVYLVGEGYFEVQKNPEKPFIVNAEDINVKVLGTKFNFRDYPGDKEAVVSLIDGKVALNNLMNQEEELILHPNERVVLDKQDGVMIKEAIEALPDMQWTEGRLVFQETPLSEVAKILGRNYGVRINFANDSLKNFHFNGNFSCSEQSLQDILEALTSTDRVQYTMEKNDIILY